MLSSYLEYSIVFKITKLYLSMNLDSVLAKQSEAKSRLVFEIAQVLGHLEPLALHRLF